MRKLFFLGPKGTYSEQCAHRILTYLDDCEPEAVSTIAKIVDLLDRSSFDMGVLPIENSIEGIVRPSVDCLYLSDVKIQAQIDVKIEHCLYSKSDISKVKHIISHPQALAQCSRYILSNFDKDIELINSNSTAEAVQILLKKDETYAAIASCASGKDSPLQILDKNIGDIKDNKTRFVLVSKNDINIASKTRTSIVFNTKNEPGALLKVLSIINNHNLNLVYIESRPSKSVFGEYNFFADIDRGIDEIEDALLEIKNECNFYKLLGSYPVLV